MVFCRNEKLQNLTMAAGKKTLERKNGNVHDCDFYVDNEGVFPISRMDDPRKAWWEKCISKKNIADIYMPHKL